MITPFDNLPYNTEKVFTMGTTNSGCEIYIPVIINNDVLINQRKHELQEWLNNQAPVDTELPDNLA